MAWNKFLECRSRTLAGSQLYINQRVLYELADLLTEWLDSVEDLEIRGFRNWRRKLQDWGQCKY
jgi:hypothetical protein